MVWSIFAREIVACVVRFVDFWMFWLLVTLFWRMMGSIFAREIVACVVRFGDFWLFWLLGPFSAGWWGRFSLAKSWPVGIFQQPLPPSNNPSDGMEPYKRLSTTPSDGFAPSKLLQTTLPRVWGLAGVFQQPLPKGMGHTVTWCRSRFSLSTNPSEGVGWARNDPQWYFN